MMDQFNQIRPDQETVDGKKWRFLVGGILFEVESDLPVSESTFHPKLLRFHASPFASDPVKIRHHFYLPEERSSSGHVLYEQSPWRISFQENLWIYQHITQSTEPATLNLMALFAGDHSKGDIYHPNAFDFEKGGLCSITMLANDQIVLARILADHEGFMFHASGMDIGGQGLLFAGHSGAGKSTILRMLQGAGEILCDDRMIIRRWPDGYRIYGTWSHGEIPIVSPGPAPLRGIMLLEQARENQIVRVEDRRELARILPFLVIKPLVTADWWEKTFDLLEKIVREVPVYRLRFDKSGQVVDLIHDFLAGRVG